MASMANALQSCNACCCLGTWSFTTLVSTSSGPWRYARKYLDSRYPNSRRCLRTCLDIFHVIVVPKRNLWKASLPLWCTIVPLCAQDKIIILKLKLPSGPSKAQKVSILISARNTLISMDEWWIHKVLPTSSKTCLGSFPKSQHDRKARGVASHWYLGMWVCLMWRPNRTWNARWNSVVCHEIIIRLLLLHHHHHHHHHHHFMNSCHLPLVNLMSFPVAPWAPWAAVAPRWWHRASPGPRAVGIAPPSHLWQANSGAINSAVYSHSPHSHHSSSYLIILNQSLVWPSHVSCILGCDQKVIWLFNGFYMRLLSQRSRRPPFWISTEEKTPLSLPLWSTPQIDIVQKGGASSTRSQHSQSTCNPIWCVLFVWSSWCCW